MTDEHSITTAKLDEQTSLLRWILGGVGAAIAGGAVWASSQFASFMSDKKEGEAFLRNEVKGELVKLNSGNERIAKGIDTLVDVTKKGEWRKTEQP